MAMPKLQKRQSRTEAPKKKAAPSGRHRHIPDPLAERIGARIRALREDAGIGFDAFIARTGLGRGYVSELERGLVVPSVGSLTCVADALEITLADLVLGSSDRERVFDELRGQPAALLRQVRDVIRAHARPARNTRGRRGD
jgi:transcriptional regulator with XRE-family HTH domain